MTTEREPRAQVSQSVIRRRLWLVSLCGALIFPAAARFVLPNASLPFPSMIDFGTGVFVWSAWACGFAVMACAMYLLRAEPLRTLVVAQFVGGLIFVFVWAMPSLDTYVYFGFGSLLLHGSNPWNSGHVEPFDTLSTVFTNAWGNDPPSSPYGPAFVLAEAAFVRLMSPLSGVGAVIAQRLVSLAAAVGITALIRGPKIRYWALNPFVFYYYVLEAHNDVFFLLLLAFAARVRAPFVRGVLIGCAGSIKVVALFVAAWTNRKRLILTIAGASLGVVVLYSIEPMALGVTGLASMTANFANSMDALISQMFVAMGVPSPGTRAIESFTVLAVVLVGLSLRWSRRDGLTFATLLFLVALPIFWSWYLGWALLACLSSSHRATHRFVVALSLCSFICEMPSISGFHNVPQITLVFAAVALVLPFVSGFAKRFLTWPWAEGAPLRRVGRLLPLHS